MTRSATRLLACAALALVAAVAWKAGHAQASAPQRVAGTSVSLTPPAGFTAGAGFTGFADTSTGASIMISELPAEAHAQLAPMFGNLDVARQAFGSQGITIERLERVKAPAGDLPVLAGSQKLNETQFRKWMTLARGETTTLVTFQAPTDARLDDATVRQVVSSLTLGSKPTMQEQLGALPFRFESTAPFRVVNTVGGSGVLLTSGAKDVDPAGEQPLVVIASQVTGNGIPSTAQAQTARAVLLNTRELNEAKIEEESEVTFAGAPGVLLSGATPGGKRFWQYFALGKDQRFIRLLAVVPADQAQALQPSLEGMAKSVAFRAN